jgi:hypothetical protein
MVGRITDRVTTLETDMAKLNALHEPASEHMLFFEDMAAIRRHTRRIWQSIKWGAPSVIVYLVATGKLEANLGNLLRSLFGG